MATSNKVSFVVDENIMMYRENPEHSRMIMGIIDKHYNRELIKKAKKYSLNTAPNDGYANKYLSTKERLQRKLEQRNKN